MNDLEREVREALFRHHDEAPLFDISDARRVAGRARQRQVWTVIGGGIAAAVVVIVTIAGVGGLVRADRPPTLLDPPSGSPRCMATERPGDTVVKGWPDTSKNRAGVYSWGQLRQSDSVNEGWMHNAYKPGSGDVEILFQGDAGVLIPHGEGTAVTVAGCEGTYRTFDGEVAGRWGSWEQWMVDIQGTTVTISLTAGREASEGEVAEAHQIIGSIHAVPRDDTFGFRLLFTLPTGTWDSG